MSKISNSDTKKAMFEILVKTDRIILDLYKATKYENF